MKKERKTENIPGIGEVELTKEGWIDKRKLKKPLREVVDEMRKAKENQTIEEQKKALIEALKKLKLKDQFKSIIFKTDENSSVFLFN